MRINAAVAQGLAWAHDLPVIAVSTLQALAQAAYQHDSQQHPQQSQQRSEQSQYTAILDARMQEVYVGHFQADANGVMQLQGDELLLNYAAANDYVQQFADGCWVGSGAHLLDATLAKRIININASAVQIAQIAYPIAVAGLGVAPELALPVYLRDNAWKKIAEQGKARG